MRSPGEGRFQNSMNRAKERDHRRVDPTDASAGVAKTDCNRECDVNADRQRGEARQRTIADLPFGCFPDRTETSRIERAAREGSEGEREDEPE
jgi:hypothetical protein